MTVEVFHQEMFLKRQMIDALTCPINRHGTRVEYNCDDWGLWRNPNLLVQHYIENGGAKEFAKRRGEFLEEIVVPDEIEFVI